MACFQLRPARISAFRSKTRLYVLFFPPPLPSSSRSGAVGSSIPPSQPPSAATPPSPDHPLQRFSAKCDLHVTTGTRQGCPPPLACHHHHCHSPPAAFAKPPPHPSLPLEAAERERPPRGACTSQKATVTVPYYALPQ